MVCPGGRGKGIKEGMWVQEGKVGFKEGYVGPGGEGWGMKEGM